MSVPPGDITGVRNAHARLGRVPARFDGLVQRVVTWAGENHAAAAAFIILGAAVAASVIILMAPSEPGGAKPNHPYLVAGAGANDPARPPYPVRAPLPLPRRYIGVYEPAGGSSYVPVSGHRAADRPPKVMIYYSGWYQGFNTTFAEDARKADAVPLIQIEPRSVSLAAIARGDYDSYLRSYADAVASYQGAVIIGFGQEMNERLYTWGYRKTSPAVFVQAWRRVVNVFRSQNADNVTWMWTIGKSSTMARPLRDWWPDARYVTWIGVDGYYELPGPAPTSAFAGTIARIRRITGDPVLLFGDGLSAP
jgi:mannan endo-1,4-beta-mannosidase